MEGNAAWCCRIFSENILGAGSEPSLLPSSWVRSSIAGSVSSRMLGWPWGHPYGRMQISRVLQVIFSVPVAEMDHGSRTSWAVGNTSLRHRRSLPCCHRSQTSQLRSLQTAPFHNPFDATFSSRRTEQIIIGIA